MRIRVPKEVRFIALVGFLLSAVWVIESLVAEIFGDQTLAPLLSMISFVFIASYFNYPFVLFSILPFCLLSYGLIHDSSQYPIIRTITLGVAGLIAAWASWQRGRLSRQMREFEVVILNIPMPWILSDPNGNVLRVSPLFASLVGKTQEELLGVPHFSLIVSAEDEPSTQGAGDFLGKSRNLQIHPFLSTDPSKLFKATYVPVLIQSDHCLLTILG